MTDDAIRTDRPDRPVAGPASAARRDPLPRRRPRAGPRSSWRRYPEAVWVQTAEECIARLAEAWDEVHLDHDLGGEHFVDLEPRRLRDGGRPLALPASRRPHLTTTRFFVHSHNAERRRDDGHADACAQRLPGRVPPVRRRSHRPARRPRTVWNRRPALATAGCRRLRRAEAGACARSRADSTAAERLRRTAPRRSDCEPPTGAGSPSSRADVPERRLALSMRRPRSVVGSRSRGRQDHRRDQEELALRTVITGGAGFVGSHLCERFLAEGRRGHLRRQPADRAPPQHRPPARTTRGSGSSSTTSPSRSQIDGPVDNVLHFASPASPADYLAHPIPTLKVGSLGHAQRPRAGQGQGRAVPAGQHLRGLRRPRGPPPARGLLGPRQPDRPARLLRRGQAVRRGHHDGLPPLPRRQDPDRPDLQHLRPADAAQRRPRPAHLHGPGPPRRADDHLRQGRPDPQLLLRHRPGRRDLPPAPRRLLRAGQHRQPRPRSPSSSSPRRSSPWSPGPRARSSTTTSPRTTPSAAGPTSPGPRPSSAGTPRSTAPTG